MKYQLLYSPTCEGLEEVVNSYLNGLQVKFTDAKGKEQTRIEYYNLVGGPFFTSNANPALHNAHGGWYQAVMIKL